MERIQEHKWIHFKLFLLLGVLSLLGIRCDPGAWLDTWVTIDNTDTLEGNGSGAVQPGSMLDISWLVDRNYINHVSDYYIEATITEPETALNNAMTFTNSRSGICVIRDEQKYRCGAIIFTDPTRDNTVSLQATVSEDVESGTPIKLLIMVYKSIDATIPVTSLTDTYYFSVVRPDITVFDEAGSEVPLDGEVSISPGTHTFTVRNTTPTQEGGFGAIISSISASGDATINAIFEETSGDDPSFTNGEEKTFEITCSPTFRGTVASTVTVNTNVLSKASYPFIVNCVNNRPEMYVEYEGTRVPEGSMVQIAPGFANFQIGFLAEPQSGVALDIRNLTLNGSDQIVLDSGVRSNMVLPNQETFFILECRARIAGSYSTTVMIETNLAEQDFYSFDVLCVVDETQSDGGLTGAGDVPDGGDDLNNPLPLPPAETTTGGDDSCPLGDC